MNASVWVTLACGLPVLASSVWQILRDVRKDHEEQEERAREEAVRDALVERRLRELEGRGDDDD